LAILGGWWLLALSFATLGKILAREFAGGQEAGQDCPGFAGNVAFFSAMLVMMGLVIACAAMGLWLRGSTVEISPCCGAAKLPYRRRSAGLPGPAPGRVNAQFYGRQPGSDGASP
jgi:hypothetical protein